MNAKENVKATGTNAPWTTARCLALWEEPTDVAYAELEGVPILPLAVAEIGLKGMRRRVAPVKSWGWAVTLHVTRRTGVVLFVPKSKPAYRSVRLLPVSKPLKPSLMRRRRWATFDRS
jgi:hypothetical protein